MDWLIVFLAKDLFVAIILVAFLTWWGLDKNKKIQFAAAIVVAGLLGYILSKMGGGLYYHPRPFVTEHIKPLIPHGNDNGFPSDHTWFCMTITAVIYYYNKRWALVAFILTLLVGAGRVLAHLHYPIDILGGLIVGTVAGYIGYRIVKFLIPKFSKYKQPNQDKNT